MFNDRLGSTVAVKGDESYSMTSMSAFGESSDSGAFFTGKPFIGELGYAFLMRSYRPENGKWQTADPMGYPDGWNQLAYCNNHATSSVDLWGCGEWFLDCISVSPMAGLAHTLPSQTTSGGGGDTMVVDYKISGIFYVSASTMELTHALTIESSIEICVMSHATVYHQNGDITEVQGWSEVANSGVSATFSTTYLIDSIGGVTYTGSASGTTDAEGSVGCGWLFSHDYMVALAQVVPSMFPGSDANQYFNHQVSARYATDETCLFSGISVGYGGVGLSIDFKGQDWKSPLYSGFAHIRKVYVE